VLLHVNTVHVTKMQQILVLLVNNVECGNVVNCALSDNCDGVTQKESSAHVLLFSYHLIDFRTISIRQ
jgi:hypothetical protein